jgi:formate dehydrogenase subunit beta
MKRVESELVESVEKLLQEKKIDTFLGYQDGSLPLRTSPCFVTELGDVRKLVWNSFCSNNLAVYLRSLLSVRRANTRIGILCKGCDSRSLVNLIVEKQVKREEVVIIGISCPGIINVDKLLSHLEGRQILDFEENDDEIILKFDDGEERYARREFMYESCLNCAYPTPSVYDILIRVGRHLPEPISPDPVIAEFSQKSRAERWQIFEQELSRCIRCYACRDACPNCYCKECFVEQTKPRWFGLTNSLPDVLFYHIIRILHQAGRCVDCGACVRACPENINLRLFTRVLVDEVKERFGFEPGLSLEDSALLATFSIDDKQEFMVESD